MKKTLLLLLFALSMCGVNAQKKVFIYDGAPFSPAAWDAAEMRFSDNEGKHFPYIPDDVYWGYKTLIFNITDVSDDCMMRVMNAWWSSVYRESFPLADEVKNGTWEFQLTEEVAMDCAQGNGGGGRDLNLMLTDGSCTINSVYYIDDEPSCPTDMSAYTEKVDSIETPERSKEVYKYSVDGKISQYISYNWSDNNWVSDFRIKYTYTKRGDETFVTSLYSSWDQNVDDWNTPSRKGEFSYDVRGNKTLDAHYNWDEYSQQWVGTSMYEYAYDEYSHQTLSANYTWTSWGGWEGVRKTERAFDSAGRQTLDASYSWNSNYYAWHGNYKYEYDYNDMDFQILYAYYYNWDCGMNNWMDGYKEEHNYNDKGYQTYYARYSWSYYANDWIPNYKEEYILDENNNQKEINGYSWNGNDWFHSIKYEFAFRTDGLQEGLLGYRWDSESGAWLLYQKQEYDYDNNGNQTLLLGYLWDNTLYDWVNRFKYEYTYDEGGRRTSNAYYDWESSINDWVGNYKDVWAFDSHGYQTGYAYYYWDSSINDWYGSWKYGNDYDENGNQTASYNYRWNSAIGDWVNSSKSEYTYDSNGTPSGNVYYSWDENFNIWQPNSKQEYAYDSYGNQTLSASYFWSDYDGGWHGSSKLEYVYDAYRNRTSISKFVWNSNGWDEVSSTSYKYDTSVGGTVLGINSYYKLLSVTNTTYNNGTPSSVTTKYFYSKIVNNGDSSTDFVLTDGEEYEISTAKVATSIAYTRTFNNTNWQALYVPFSMSYSDWANQFEVAYINSVDQYDSDEDGIVDKTAVHVIRIKSGSIRPNTPYLIRAKTVGRKTLKVANTILCSADENSLSCSTMLSTFTFTGTYSGVKASTMVARGLYSMGGGTLNIPSSTSALKPYRWYMSTNDRNLMLTTPSGNTRSIIVRLIGEDNGDEVQFFDPDQVSTAEGSVTVFDLNGRVISSDKLSSGTYIKNGKKVLVK